MSRAKSKAGRKTRPGKKERVAERGKQKTAQAQSVALTVSTEASLDLRVRMGKTLGLAGPVAMGLVREGLPSASVLKLCKALAITQKEMIKLLGISERTFARRKAHGRLTVDESDRVVRYATLLVLAIEMVDDAGDGAEWLKASAQALGGDAPLSHATTEMGGRNVERSIGRMEYGIPT